MEDIDDLFSCFDPTKSQNKLSNRENDSDADPKTTREIITLTKRPHELEEHGGTIKKAKVENEEDSNLFDDLNVDTLSNCTAIHTLETPDGCTHEVAVPSKLKYVPLRATTAEQAKRYKFILDPFQKEAIKCIDNLQSVLVSAHTSAGKTVVAEYAIALSLKNKQRVIYTTPIKALSNQKYREFSEEFHDVGLMTGDVTINSSASCLIMTTEILRNMLYRGSEIMREVGWVIFDEIHYMRDKERGVVWEETLILLPDNVRYVFLSATIPNARQFAEWVCRLHSQPCHVVYTEYRPTPLNHFVYPGGDEIHMVVDDKGALVQRGFDNAMDIIRNVVEPGKKKNRGYRPNASNVLKIVKMIMEKDFAPVIIFSFSKKDCEEYAKKTAKLDFNTKKEKKMVDEIFNNAMDVLSEEDRKLPQIENIIPLLRRGIGVHHSGLIPILKEVVEILFGSGLIKALFATETFAMGLNMPAKTVIFTTPRKFDGKDFRYITSGEYIQMSGRAGRRGLDEMGIVILMLDKQVTPTCVKEIVLGKADPLNSAFHLNYNMVLNLLRVEEINAEYMMERSFYQFQNQVAIPGLIDKAKAKQKEYNDYTFEDEDSVTQYCNIGSQLEVLKHQYRSFTSKPEYLKRYLNSGRLVYVVIGKYDYGWGVISSVKEKKQNSNKNASSTDEPELIVNVYLHLQREWEKNADNKPFSIVKFQTNETVDVVPVLPTDIHKISTVRCTFSKEYQEGKRTINAEIFWKMKSEYPEGPPLLDPIKDMKIDDPDFKICVDQISELEKRLSSHPIHSDERRSTLVKAYEDKQEIYQQLAQAKLELKRAKGILQMDELKKRKNVLRKLGYCTSTDVIELKGRVACELSSTDQLLLTELIFNGVFNDLTAEQSAALLSCFVCDENPGQASNTGEELRGVLRKLQEFARRIAEVSVDANMDLDKDVYVNKFKSTLMDAVLAWSRGSTFLEICKMTEVLEGSIIRSMRRLEEVLRQLCQAAKSIGNVALENKFAEAIKLLKRDIVFAASLYM